MRKQGGVGRPNAAVARDSSPGGMYITWGTNATPEGVTRPEGVTVVSLRRDFGGDCPRVGVAVRNDGGSVTCSSPLHLEQLLQLRDPH